MTSTKRRSASLCSGSTSVRTFIGPEGNLAEFCAHPVVRLATGRDLDVVALANDRISKGSRLLADVYTAARRGACPCAARARFTITAVIKTSGATTELRHTVMRGMPALG
jgi:hypothetical protein